jgi:hypothetical protein
LDFVGFLVLWHHFGTFGVRCLAGNEAPMNPSPTDAQWLVLFQVDVGEVVPDGPDRWKAKGAVRRFSVTGAIQRLYMLNLIDFTEDGTPVVTAEGEEVLKRRSVYDVLERVNRRKHY